MIRFWSLVIVVAVTSGAIAADKPADTLPKPDPKPKLKVNPTPERLAGTWRQTHLNGHPVENAEITETYTNDGKLTIEKSEGPYRLLTGTYRIDGDNVYTSLYNTTRKRNTDGYYTIIELSGQKMVIVGMPDTGSLRYEYSRIPKNK